jgi:hypothetical protein
MKYLQSYKIFENFDTNDLVQDVRDMLLELNDMDLTTVCEHYLEKQGPKGTNVRDYISIGLEKELSDDPNVWQQDIKWLDVSEVIYRVLDWMSSNDWKPSYIILDGESYPVELKDAKDFLTKKFNHYASFKQRLGRREVSAVFSTLQIDFVRVENIQESLGFNKRKEITDVLSDMSLELWDEGFNVQVSAEELTQSEKFIRVIIQKRGYEQMFKITDVSGVIDSMTSYLVSERLELSSFSVEVIEEDSREYNTYYLRNSDQVENFISDFSGDVLQIKFRFSYTNI